MIALIAVSIVYATSFDACVKRYPERLPRSGRVYFNEFDPIFNTVAARRGLEPALLKAHAWCETRLDPCAVSPAGASGLMQFMPSTFADVSLAAQATNPFDPSDSIAAAGVYIAALINFWEGDLAAAIASYNAGPGAVSAARRRGHLIPEIAETQDYVRCVLGSYRALSEPKPTLRARLSQLFAN